MMAWSEMFERDRLHQRAAMVSDLCIAQVTKFEVLMDHLNKLQREAK
jgi:hypothetical protein